MRFLVNVFLVGLLALGVPAGAADFSEGELAGLVREQARNYFAAFQHPETGVLYGSRLEGRKGFASPEEVMAEIPHPWGYGSRIADTCLHTGHMLVALLDAYEAKPEPWMREQIAKHFAALKLIGSLPEMHPKEGKPALEGLVVRGPHPDDLSAYYDDSSMDQHTTYIIALAAYAKSTVATAEEKAWIAESLGKVGRRLEGNGWRILRADGKTEAHVGFSWKGFRSNHASILLPAVAALYAGTGDGHWKEVYEGFLSEREGERWKLMHPGPHVRINGHPIYANQNAFRLSGYWRFEEDAARREVIEGLMEQSIDLQLGRDFPGEMYRGFQPEEKWVRLAEMCGWEDRELRGAAEAWKRFRPEFLTGEEKGLAALAHVRFPLGGYHMALMSERAETREAVVPEVWEMLSTVDLEEIAAGETHYLFTVVGLHLWALHFGGSEGKEGSYGEELTIARDVGIGTANDVVASGDRAWAIGHGSIFLLDISERGEPKVTGELKGLGATRQMVVRDDVAYVTAREDGVFIVDVSDEEKPVLLDHYDSIEFATGIAISGDVLFVACRHFGVELVDVSDPKKPRHMSTVRTGEAQSVTARDGYLYAGVWGSSELVVADVRDPWKPVITARRKLDGYGDGVDVEGEYLYVATGHHSKEQPRKKEGDPGFGKGHGLEIFSISDPSEPAFLSRVKTPPFYYIGNDTWRVKVAGKKAFLADTHNGMFVVDVSDAKAPVIEARCVLPYVEKRKVEGHVTGVWPVEDHLYVSGGWTDLHVVELRGVARPPVVEADAAPVVGARPEESGEEGRRVYRPAGQVYAVEFLEDGRAVVACGVDGVQVVDLSGKEIKRVGKFETKGFATDVAVTRSAGSGQVRELVLVAESEGGLSICEVAGKGLRKIGHFQSGSRSVRQVEIADGHAMIVEGSSRLRMLDLTNSKEPKSVLEDQQPGLLYGDQLMRGLVENRYAAVFWHVSGLHWYDMKAEGGPVRSGDNWAARFGSPNGLFSLGDRILATTRGGYFLVKRDERRALDEAPLIRLGTERKHLGRVTVAGDRIYCAERAYGLVTVADVSDLENPALLEQFVMRGNPGRIAVNKEYVSIPAGVEGLIVLKR